MPGEKNDDPIEAMISSQTPDPDAPAEQPPSEEKPASEKPKREPRSPPLRPPTHSEAHLEVRPIGTPLGLRELATLHKRTWKMLNLEEKRVHVLLWPLAIHFGLYAVGAGSERRRPPLIGAFWARCLADAPLTLGHLYPAPLFKGMLASEVFEFVGLVSDPAFQGKGPGKLKWGAARWSVFRCRPERAVTGRCKP